MDIAERIKKIREEFEITSNDYAKITGIHPVSIRKYETRKMVPGIEVIDKMCEALRLNRMVFEGIPKQYTDFNYVGDFYENLFLLLENETLSYSFNKEEKNDISFLINPILSKYIQIKNGDEVIPIENITIQYNSENKRLTESISMFRIYADCLRLADEAINSERWDEKEQGETKEEYASRLLELAEATQLKLMLIDHSWKQYMGGNNDNDSLNAEMHAHILSGGDYYSYIMQMDIPETKKAQYIESYEETYVKEIVQKEMDTYPINGTQEEQNKWIHTLIALINQYKTDHPEYKMMAQKHALDIAALIREENKTES